MPVPPHALVLAAGLGTRLRPLTAVRAKPALPLGGDALIRHILSWLAAADVRDAVVNLHHLPHTLTAALGDGGDLGVRVRYSWEQPVVLGSAGGPRQALDIVGADTFWLVNGDTLTNVDLVRMTRSHMERGALVTLALIPNTEFLHYGGVRVTGDGIVSGFVAKGPAAAGSFHLVGVQLVSRKAFEALPQGVPVNSVGALYDRLIADRPGSIRAFVSDATFQDIGTVEDYWRTSHHFSMAMPADARVATSATVDDSILWNRVTIGEHASIRECIVTDDVVVPDGAVFRRKMLIRGGDGAIDATGF